VLIRYFGAAKAATGLDEEALDVGDGAPLSAVLTMLQERHRDSHRRGDGSAPALAEVLARSSFLRNEVSVRDPESPMADGDTLDVLPPFAGG